MQNIENIISNKELLTTYKVLSLLEDPKYTNQITSVKNIIANAIAKISVKNGDI